MATRREVAPGDIGVYFDLADDDKCDCCGDPIEAGATAIIDADGLLCGYDCGCGDPYYADVPAGS